MENIELVDTFIKRNKKHYEIDSCYQDLTSLFEALNEEDCYILNIQDQQEETKPINYGEMVAKHNMRQKIYKQMDAENLNVIYECPCKKKYKQKHHFDYNKPNDILLLCRSCHAKEHHRLATQELKDKPY